MGARQDTQARPGVMITLAILLAIVLFIGALFYIYHQLGINASYPGFLFIFYWLGLMHQAPGAYLPSLAGALGGVAMAWILIAMPPLVGPAGMVVAGVALAAVLFCLIRGQLSFFINNAMMLFMTVATIPEVDIAAIPKVRFLAMSEAGFMDKALEMAASISVAALYIGGLAWVMTQIMARRQDKAEVAAAE